MTAVPPRRRIAWWASESAFRRMVDRTVVDGSVFRTATIVVARLARSEHMFDTGSMAAAESAVGSADPFTDRPIEPDARRARLRLVGDQVRPLALARERTMPVLPVLADLFPEGGLRRGSVVTIHGSGATLLALAVAAGPSAVGSWTAIVGDETLGMAAAAEAGVALERVLVVDPGDADSWGSTMAALVGAVDVVVVGPGPRRPGTTRKISSRLRERGSVVVTVGGSWSPGADTALTIEQAVWTGLGEGHGVLRSRQVAVHATGRGESARPRRIDLLLPGPDGAPAPVEAVDAQWAAADIDRLIDAG